MAQIRIDDDVYERLKRSAEVDGRSVGMQIDYLLRNRLILEEIAEKLSAGGVVEKQNPDPQKSRGLTPIRTPQVIDKEITQLDLAEFNELEFVQDEEVLAEKHAQYENKRIALREEKTEFYNNLKRG